MNQLAFREIRKKGLKCDEERQNKGQEDQKGNVEGQEGEKDKMKLKMMGMRRQKNKKKKKKRKGRKDP